MSVIIPNYNREKTLVNTILSVINQTYRNIEIIIVDDKSTDNSRNIIKNLAKKYNNIKYYFSNENKGANYSRNKGAELANGEYLAFLDSDDRFLPTKIEKQVEVLKQFKDKDIGIVFTNILINNKAVAPISENKIIKLEDIVFRNKLGGFSTVLIRKDIFFEIGKLDEDLLSCQDWNLYLKVLSKYKGYMLSEPLVKYFLQPDSISKNKYYVLKGHEIVLNRIRKINSKYHLVAEDLLIYHQNYLLGDIYRNFYMFNEAKKKYISCLKYKFNPKIVLKLLSMSVGKKPYNIIKEIKSKL